MFDSNHSHVLNRISTTTKCDSKCDSNHSHVLNVISTSTKCDSKCDSNHSHVLNVSKCASNFMKSYAHFCFFPMTYVHEIPIKMLVSLFNNIVSIPNIYI